MSTKEEITLIKAKMQQAKLMKKKETLNKKISSTRVPKPQFAKFRDFSKVFPKEKTKEQPKKFRWD